MISENIIDDVQADDVQADETEDTDCVTEWWPKGIATINVCVKPNAVARLRLDDIRPWFESTYPSFTRPEIGDEELTDLLVKAGISPVAGADNEFHAERLPGYDFSAEKAQKITWLDGWIKRANTPAKDAATYQPPLRGIFKTPRVAAADRALRVGGSDVTRLKTGLPSLDAATRGGILLRKVAVFGGAPGAGKTALLVRLAYSWLTQGIVVGILAADEDADGLLIRLGQLHGLSRDALENGDKVARGALAAWCKSVPLILFDGDEDDGTIEALSREVRVKAGKNASALIVDSMQTARSEVPVTKGADLRAKINVTVGALKRAAKVDGHVVLASSELSKAAYRNKDTAENVNALSAFKESGDIEYGVSLAVVLTSRTGSSELVDASVVKNRLGREKPAFMLRLDHERADVIEASGKDMATIGPSYFVKLDIKAVVENACGNPLSKNQIAERVGGTREKVLKMIAQLVDAHELHQERRGIRFPLPGDPGYVAPT